jgi:hypothetical protein
LRQPDKILFSDSKSSAIQGPTFQITLESWLGFGKQPLRYMYVQAVSKSAGKVSETTFPKSKSKTKAISNHLYLLYLIAAMLE